MLTETPLQVDHETAAKSLGVTKAACRMRLVRLQQKYSFKAKGKGTPRGKKEKASSNNEEVPAGEEATENWDAGNTLATAVASSLDSEEGGDGWYATMKESSYSHSTIILLLTLPKLDLHVNL